MASDVHQVHSRHPCDSHAAMQRKAACYFLPLRCVVHTDVPSCMSTL
jgi:hypothetical protein